MSRHNSKTAIRERMASTGENYTTARRALQEDSGEITRFWAQYVSTSSLEVIEALRQRDLIRAYLWHLRAEFARECNGQTSVFMMGRGSIRQMASIGGDRPSGKGRWKAGPRGQGWQPAKGNPLLERFEALAKAPEVSVPGAPSGFIVGSRILTVEPFVQAERAWIMLAADPGALSSGEPGPHEGFSAPWEVVRGSEAMRAKEDWDEEHAGKPAPTLSDEELAEAEALRVRLVQEQQAWRARQRAALWGEEEDSQSEADALASPEAVEPPKTEEQPKPVRAQFVRTDDPAIVKIVREAWEARNIAQERFSDWAERWRKSLSDTDRD